MEQEQINNTLELADEVWREGTPCIYCKKPILNTEALQVRKVLNKTVAWHYRCGTKYITQLIPLSENAKGELKQFLTDSFPKPFGWVLEVLLALDK